MDTGVPVATRGDSVEGNVNAVWMVVALWLQSSMICIGDNSMRTAMTKMVGLR